MWTIKQNDTKPYFSVALKQDYGEDSEAAINLSTADHVNFIMRYITDTDIEGPKVKAACVVDDVNLGIVTYRWDSDDTDTIGIFNVEFEIVWNDGRIQTVPNNVYGQLEVVDDLG